MKSGKEQMDIWLERVRYDIETADAMHRTGRYLYVIFIAQQAIKKAIKAFIETRKKEMIQWCTVRINSIK